MRRRSNSVTANHIDINADGTICAITHIDAIEANTVATGNN